MTAGDRDAPLGFVESARRRVAAGRIENLIVYLGFLVIFAFFAVVLRDRGFLTPDNLANIGRQTAMVSIMAVGMTFALSAGEIDLSIGSIVALSAMVAAILLRDGHFSLAIAAALGVGLLTGFVNGLLTTKVRIPSFLVTLGMMSILVGLARITTNLEPVPITNQAYVFWFGSGDLGPIPILLVWTAVFVFAGHVLLRFTPFGRHLLATGGNRTAARYSGIDTDRIKIAALMISATCAAVAGMLFAGRLHGARYTLGETELMTVIAATVIGGTSLFGGRGSVIGALVGSLLMGVLNNGLLLLGLTVSEQLVARGAIIIVAVALSLREARTS
jgi:ribose transport system permease protein